MLRWKLNRRHNFFRVDRRFGYTFCLTHVLWANRRNSNDALNTFYTKINTTLRGKLHKSAAATVVASAAVCSDQNRMSRNRKGIVTLNEQHCIRQHVFWYKHAIFLVGRSFGRIFRSKSPKRLIHLKHETRWKRPIALIRNVYFIYANERLKHQIYHRIHWLDAPTFQHTHSIDVMFTHWSHFESHSRWDVH